MEKNNNMKKTNKTRRYRELLEKLQKEFFGGNYDDFSCGNTMGLYVRNPYRCITLFEKFEKLKNT